MAKALRWSVGLLAAASFFLVAGFVATDALSDEEFRRWGAPSADPLARLEVPSEGTVRIDRPATYVLYYEQEAPATGVPKKLEVAIRSETGELGLGNPPDTTPTVVDGRSFVALKTVRIPRSGTYTVVVDRPGRAALSALGDDRVVIDRTDRNAETLRVLLGLTPAVIGVALAAGLGAAGLWVRYRAMRAWRLTQLGSSGGADRES